MAEATGGNEKAGEKNSVVAQVNEIACGDGAGASAHVSENHADADQQADLSPGAPELLGVRESKQSAGGHNARSDTKLSGDHGVNTTAENGLLDYGSHENTERHEHQNALTAAEKLFHGNAGFPADKITQPT